MVIEKGHFIFAKSEHPLAMAPATLAKLTGDQRWRQAHST
jgi:hypothetical protein